MKDNSNIFENTARLKSILNFSQVQNREGGKTFLNIDTIHFSSKLPNVLEIAKEANKIITPVPVNYKNVCASGWVD